MSMKKLILVLLASTILLTGCTTFFVPKKASHDEEVYASQLVATQGYQLVYGSVEFYGSSFRRVNIFTAKAYVGTKLGYIMVNKSTEPAKIVWSQNGEFNVVDVPAPAMF